MSQDPVASEALAACPFCKARGEGVAVHRLVHAAGYWSVECDHCDCRGPSNDTARGAADEWNKRAPAAPAVGDAQRIAKDFPYTPQDWLEVASRHMDDPITTMGADMAAMMNRLMTAEQRAEKAEAELSLLRQAGQVISKSQARRVMEFDEEDVERAAKAMYYTGNSHGWDNESDSCRWEYLEMAKAARAAMRGEKGAT